jgi:hypothetical protein
MKNIIWLGTREKKQILNALMREKGHEIAKS